MIREARPEGWDAIRPFIHQIVVETNHPRHDYVALLIMHRFL